MRKKCKKMIKHWKFFLSRFAHSAFYKIHFSGAADHHAPVQYAKYVFFCFVFFLSSHHDTNPILHLYHFRKKNIIIYWLILTMNHQGSYFPFFVFIKWVKHFCTPANFVTIWSTVLNSKKIFIYNLCFGLSKLYTNIQQDQKAKLDYHMSMLFAYIWRVGRGWGLEVLKCFVRIFSTCFVCICVCVCWRCFKMFCQNFFYLLCVCVCVCGGGGGVRFSTCPSVRKITDPLLLINDWSL